LRASKAAKNQGSKTARDRTTDNRTVVGGRADETPVSQVIPGLAGAGGSQKTANVRRVVALTGRTVDVVA
jgi:hypothetical protein